MKRFLLIAALLVFAVSCKKEQDKTQIIPQDFDTEEVALDSSDVADCKDKACPKIDIQFTKIEGDSDFARTVNAQNEKELIKILHISQDKPKATSVEAALEGFVEDYFKFKAIDSLTRTSYEAVIDQELKSKNDRTVVFKTSHYIYTGGAHGYGGITFANYNAETGALLTQEDLIKDRSGFTDFMEEKFRQQYQIPKEANINSKGFLFEDDKFVLPENIAVTDKEVILIYNPYEAASYADGQLRFVFPKASVEKYFKY